MKVMSTRHITKDIMVDQFDDIVANITTDNFLGLNHDELPYEGRSQNKPLHILLRCV